MSKLKAGVKHSISPKTTFAPNLIQSRSQPIHFFLLLNTV